MSLRGEITTSTGSKSGSDLGITQAFTKDGIKVVIKRFGHADVIEKERAGLKAFCGSPVKSAHTPFKQLATTVLLLYSDAAKNITDTHIAVNSGITFIKGKHHAYSSTKS